MNTTSVLSIHHWGHVTMIGLKNGINLHTYKRHKLRRGQRVGVNKEPSATFGHGYISLYRRKKSNWAKFFETRI